MITITLQESTDCYYIKAVGHSGVSGQSIVCAGVSVLLETWRLAEQALEQQKIPFGEGIVEGKVAKTTISKILFAHLSIGITALKQQYPDEITLNIGG